VAKQCDHCGKVLPNDRIRYCPGCGKSVASSRPLKKSISQDPPAWMKQLETSLTNNRSNLPLRELNVTVWEEEETSTLASTENGKDEVDPQVADGLPTSPLMVTSSPKTSVPSQAQSSLSGIDVGKEDLAEELATNPNIASLPQNASLSYVPSSPGFDFANGGFSHDQIEEMATRPYVAQPHNPPQGSEKPVQYQQRQAMQTPPGIMDTPAMQRPVTPIALPIPQSQMPAFQPVRQTPAGSMPVPPLAKAPKKGRKRLAIVFVFLLIFLLGGVIAWVILAQPFTVPEITRTTQSFTDTAAGVSLQYPKNWAVAVNKQNGTVSLYDDNHTDQVNITVVVAGNQNMNQYVSKTVSSQGITGQRALPEASFAGASWQQIQGNVQESGASYSATILVTMHGQHYYTIEQLAPSSTYALEDQLVFSKIRASFQF
jgi:PsbP